MSDTVKTAAKKTPSLGRFLWPLALLAAFAVGFLISGGDQPVTPGEDSAVAAAEEPTIWTCSMHPQIKLPTSGQCPICFMDLIALETDDGQDLGPRTLVMSENAAALAEIQTTLVESREVTSQVKLIGKITYDETLYKTISAWVPGRVDNLYVDFTGAEVKAGQKLAGVYSPELFAAQTELLSAVKAHADLVESQDQLLVDTAAATVKAARQRLRLWGMSADQVENVIDRETASDHMDISSPLDGVVVHKNVLEGMYLKTGTKMFTVADLSRIWVSLEAYESDLALLENGQEIEFTVEALPGRSFSGQIIFINPVLDPRTRTAEVRLAVENQDSLLKPGMFVNARARGGLGAGSENGSAEQLVIPATAPLITGKRAVVYVKHEGTEKPTFSGREIALGPRVGDSYVVESGLMAGERVVTRGNFKIDSALQIQAKPSMMNPQGGGTMAGHNHGGMAMPAAENPPPPVNSHRDPVEAIPTPEAFRAQLGAVMDAYLAIQVSLAGDDDQAASAGAANLLQSLDSVDMALLKGEAHMAWMRDLEKLQISAQDLIEAQDIETRRSLIQPLTETLWPVSRRFGVRTDETLRLFHCPMANDNQGADWIQTSPTTANPYYGSSMLRCGSQVDTLAVTHDSEGR